MNESKHDWGKPMDLDHITAAFGAEMKHIPKWQDIPEEFRNLSRRNKWHNLQSDWFFKGLPEGTEFEPRDDISPAMAIRHLTAIQKSFQPKHEHKQAAVAWLMSRWFNDVRKPEEAAK